MDTAVLEPLKAAETLLTAEEYYTTCRLKNTELIDGKVVELMPVSFDHGDYAGNIYSFLKAFVRKHNLGRVSVEAGYRLRRQPDLVRGPDVSFLETARLEGQRTESFIDGPPTLAVDVISPGDLWFEIEDKVRLYLEAGAKAVWLVEPQRRALIIRRADGAPITYFEGDIVPGGEILPGFELPVSEIFE